MAWAYPDIYVLRHGETTWNAEGRMQGVLNSPLTSKGISQAERQGRLLQGQDLTGFQVLVSPQGRAFQTAAIALGPLVDSLHTDTALREIEVGSWSGLLRSELPTFPDMEETPDGALAQYDHAPGGEGFSGLRERCRSFLESLEGPSVLVTHGITSRMLRALHMGRDIDALGELPGGQGVVFYLSGGEHHTLSENMTLA